MDCSLPGSSVHGILQVRILEWVAISFSRESSLPSNQTQVSCTTGRFFTNWATREAPTLGEQTLNSSPSVPCVHALSRYLFIHSANALWWESSQSTIPCAVTQSGARNKVLFLLRCLWRGKQKMTAPRSKNPAHQGSNRDTHSRWSDASECHPPSFQQPPAASGHKPGALCSALHSRAPLISRKGKPISTHRKWLLESELQFLKPENDSRGL